MLSRQWENRVPQFFDCRVAKRMTKKQYYLGKNSVLQGSHFPLKLGNLYFFFSYGQGCQMLCLSVDNIMEISDSRPSFLFEVWQPLAIAKHLVFGARLETSFGLLFPRVFFLLSSVSLHVSPTSREPLS